MATGDYSACSLTHGHEHEHEHEILRTTHARAAAASGCKMSGGMRSAANWMVAVAPGGIGPTVSMWLGWKCGAPVDTCMKPPPPGGDAACTWSVCRTGGNACM